MAKWRPGDQTEIPDDEPLSNEDMARIEDQRNKSQRALIHRAAAAGMTPMELFASGQVTAPEVDDRLAFDKSRQLPAASTQPQISEDKEEVIVALDPASSIKEGEAVVFVKKDDGSWERIGTAEPGALQLREDTPERPRPTWERPKTELQERMDAWLARDGGKSFMEGFASYGDSGQGVYDAAGLLRSRKDLRDELQTPRAGEDEAVPPTSDGDLVDTPWEGVKIRMHPPMEGWVDDDEVAEGEIVGFIPGEKGKGSEEDDDIMEAEVVDDPGPEGSPEGQAGSASDNQRRDDP